MTEDDVRRLVRERGSQRQLARQAGVSESFVSQFMSGRVGPGPNILEALGLEIVYAKKASCATDLRGA
jgi:transcriptional regulator with XRE-family HTH domain